MSFPRLLICNLVGTMTWLFLVGKHPTIPHVVGNVLATILIWLFLFKRKQIVERAKRVCSQFKPYRKMVGGKWEFILDRWGCLGCNYYNQNYKNEWAKNGTWVQVTEFTKPEFCHSKKVWLVEDYTNTTPRYVSPHIYR